MTLLATVFCTEAQLTRRFGATALLMWSDHDEDRIADTGVVDDAINQATEELLLFLGQRYSSAGLAASEIVNRWAVTLAGYFLSTSRGNSPPEWLQVEFERIMLKLPLVQSGQQALPGVALNGDLRPAMSNLTIDQRFRRSTVRVTPANSTDAPSTLTQDTTFDSPSYLD